MNLTNNPQLLDRLAASYALGTLRYGARRRFETLAREHPAMRAAALAWQSRLAALTELQPAIAPNPAVWRRIDNLLAAERESLGMRAPRPRAPADASTGRWHWLTSVNVWRGLAAAGVAATVLAVVGSVQLRAQLEGENRELQAKLESAPQIEYVAVLADDKSAASVLVSFDPKNRRLTLQRVGTFQEAGDKSLQLWALTSAGGVRSLGVLGSERLLKLSAADADMREVPTLAISLEPKGGVPGAGGPTGPVLFKGALIQKQL